MMRKRVWIMLMTLSMFFVAHAQATKTYKFWTSTPGACPIIVSVNGDSYKLTSGSSTFTLTLSGSPSISAYDKYGDAMHIKREAVYDGSRTHLQYVSVNVGANHWQHIPRSNVKNSSSGESSSSSRDSSLTSEDSSGDYSSSDNSGGVVDKAAEELGGAVGGSVASGVSKLFEKGIGQESDGYPNFQIRAGVSRAYGEFAGLKWCTGSESGFALYGGIGKDWFFNGDNHKKVLWHAGIGVYTSIDGDVDDFSFGIAYSESAIIKETLMLEASYSRFFGDGQRIGFFVGGGFGYGNVGSIKEDKEGHLNTKDAKFVWDARIGIAFKLWTHRMYK